MRPNEGGERSDDIIVATDSDLKRILFFRKVLSMPGRLLRLGVVKAS